MSRKPVILYADDDPDDRELFREVLLESGLDCHLVETANGRETLLYLRSSKSLQQPPALVLLDLNMPVLSGRETLAIMKSEQETEGGDSAVSDHSISFLIDHPKLYEERRHAALFTGRLKLAV